jgi:hypothetical protein
MGGQHLGQHGGREVNRIEPDRAEPSRDDPAEPPIPALSHPEPGQHDDHGERDAQQADQPHVNQRIVRNQAAQPHQPADQPRQQPGAYAVLEFPRHHAGAERQPMPLLEILKCLVDEQHVGLRPDHRGADREPHQQHRRQSDRAGGQARANPTYAEAGRVK